MRDIRFGAADGKLYSQYWKVAPTTNRPELVIVGSRTGRFLHLTMHEDVAFWHIKVTLPTGEAIEQPWEPPREALSGAPGVRRLVQLVMPHATVRYPKPRRSGRVNWYQAPPDTDTWVEFTVLLCAEGVPTIKSADVIGAVPMADGRAVMVIARHTPGASGSHTFRAETPDEVRRQISESGSVGALIHGAHEVDGCLWFLHLHNTPPPGAE